MTRKWVTNEGLHYINVKERGAVGDGTTDDGPAIQDVIDELAAAGGGEVVFPRPSVAYQIVAAPLVPKTGVHLVAPGGRYISANQIRLRSSTVSLFTATADVTGIRIEGLGFSAASGAGHIFDMAGFNINMWTIDRCSFMQFNNAKSIMRTGNGDAIELHVSRCYNLVNTTATVPGWNMVSDANAINVCSWTKSRFENSGNYAIHIETAGGGYCQDITIADNNFEVCLGGEVRLLSCRNVTLERLAGWDGGTYTKDRVYIGQSATGADSANVRCVQVVRRGGALGGGIYDIHLVTNEALNVTLERCNGAINMGTTPSNIVLGYDTSTPTATFSNVYEDNIVLQGGRVTSQYAEIAGTAGAGYLEFTAEQSSTPAAPAANGARVFTKDLGSGTQLYARFNTGNSYRLATQGADPTKNTTANRPTLVASDIGTIYFDTTLDADGKPIWWTGTAWVDATGATV